MRLREVLRRRKRGRHRDWHHVYLRACPVCSCCGRHYTPYPLEPEEMQLEECTTLCKTCLEWMKRLGDVFCATPEDDEMEERLNQEGR